jgi:hypothetical protein
LTHQEGRSAMIQDQPVAKTIYTQKAFYGACYQSGGVNQASRFYFAGGKDKWKKRF